jgi:hypothetical protein
MAKQIIVPARKRFDKQLLLLSSQMRTMKDKGSVSFDLYKAGARTPLFMLESLARIHRGIHDKKIFGKLYETFKLPEDLLGAIDYYHVLHLDFGRKKNVPKPVAAYFAEGRENAVTAMDKMLKKEKWLKKQKKFKKINSKLEKAGWIGHPEERSAIAEFMITEIQDIKDQLLKGVLSCNDIESGVHELRRKLRWLSIYPASLNGLIQLEKQKTVPPNLKKYLTTREMNSPFNKFPSPPKGIRPIKFTDSHFYGLSWMIAELGRLKDIGLSMHALTEALKHTGLEEGEAAARKAALLSGHKNITIQSLLQEADKITHVFVNKDHMLDRLENDLARYL